jgi:hypothetical protein
MPNAPIGNNCPDVVDYSKHDLSRLVWRVAIASAAIRGHGDGRTVSKAILVPLPGIILGTSIFSGIFSILTLVICILQIQVLSVQDSHFDCS